MPDAQGVTEQKEESPPGREDSLVILAKRIKFRHESEANNI